MKAPAFAITPLAWFRKRSAFPASSRPARPGRTGRLILQAWPAIQ